MEAKGISPSYIFIASAKLPYTLWKQPINLFPITPRYTFIIRKSASITNALAISLLLATCPSFLASDSFLDVGSSVFSPPGPSLAKNCRLYASTSLFCSIHCLLLSAKRAHARLACLWQRFLRRVTSHHGFHKGGNHTPHLVINKIGCIRQHGSGYK